MSARRPRRVVVVGAGLAGLSAALHLRGAGLDVVVLEARSTPGGRCPDVAEDGYRLDLGPTVLTETDQLAAVFAAVGESLTDHLTLLDVDPAYLAHFADGTALPMHSDRAAMRAAIEEFAGPREADGYDRFATRAAQLYDVELPHFIARNLDGVHSLLGPPLLRLAALGGFGRLESLLARCFRDPRLRQAFGFQSMYVGLPPHRARGMFAAISAMDLLHGVSYPRGGMFAIVRALADAADRHGVPIRTDARVEAVRPVGDGYAVRTGEHIEPADAVVLTCEPATAGALLDDAGSVAPPRVPSPSCVLLAAGVPDGLPGAAHHRLHFGSRLRASLDDVTGGRPMRDPSFLVSVPTRTDPSLAPEGADVLYALFPAPARHGAGAQLDWARLRGPYRDHVLRTLTAHGYPCDHLVGERFVTPKDWSAHGLPHGTPFSAAHTFTQSGPFRQPNVLRPGVVLAGSGTTPGVGVPMVLISGRLAAQRLLGADG